MKHRIILKVCQDGDFASIKFELGRYGLEIVDFSAVSDALSVAAPIAFLIHPAQGLVELGEGIAELHAQLGAETRLVACAPRPASMRAIRKSGADGLVTPSSWTPVAIAERILGVLITAGAVGPVRFGCLKGATLAMRKVYQDISVQAPLSDPVLILGETGTGKEMVGQELHARSGRDGKCLTLNCAALTLELLESELFGHERGAFTGASTKRPGLILEAGKGTLFLDEIAELAAPAQAKLLRMIEENHVRPVGSNRWVPIKARIVLATNRDLEKEIDMGNFRADLYERIGGFRVELPLLRSRRPDIPLLAKHFVAEFDKEEGGSRSIPSSTMDLLFRHDWPGNVRQLRKVMRLASAYASDPVGPINSARLQEELQVRTRRSPSHVVPFDPTTDSWKDVQNRARVRYLRSVLKQTGGDRTAAAKQSGISRARLYELLKDIEL